MNINLDPNPNRLLSHLKKSSGKKFLSNLKNSTSKPDKSDITILPLHHFPRSYIPSPISKGQSIQRSKISTSRHMLHLLIKALSVNIMKIVQPLSSTFLDLSIVLNGSGKKLHISVFLMAMEVSTVPIFSETICIYSYQNKKGTYSIQPQLSQ